jgi:gluconolactonase
LHKKSDRLSFVNAGGFGEEGRKSFMTELRVITTGLRFPEGPVALKDGSVALVEIERGTVSRVRPDGTIEVIARPGGGPNGLAVGPDGAFYVCNNGGFAWHEEPGLLRPTRQPPDYSGGRIERVDPATGAVRVLYDSCNGYPLRGPNDIVFDHQGGFYFTDLGKVRERDRDWGGVYYAKPDGSFITAVAYPVLTPNGIGLSPDDSVLYVAESETARLWAFDLEAPGVARKRPFPSPHGGRLVCGMSGYRRFDSLAVEAGGNICVATLVTGQITVIAPDGRIVREVPMPDIYTTNICFGGPDLRTAFITLSGTGKLVAMDWPEPGLRLAFEI